MDNGMIILTTLLVPLAIFLLYSYWLHLRKKNHLLTIESDWNNFKKAIVNNHIEGVSKFGTHLIWNEHLNMNKLKEMSALIKTFEDRIPEHDTKNNLKELKLLIYNKYLDWNIDYPYPG